MKKLLLLHPPPPCGGGEIQALYLKQYFEKKVDYYIYDYSRNKLTRAEQGRLNINNIIFGLRWIMKACKNIIVIRPNIIYFTLPKGYYALLRNGIIIIVSRLFRIRVLGELPGASFNFLDIGKGFKYITGLFILRRVSEIRLLSNSIASNHQKYRFKKTVVIDNGVYVPSDCQVVADNLYAPTLKMMYIGVLSYSKGIFNSIRALKLCRDSKMNLHFDIIGQWESAKEKDDVDKYIFENGLSELITFHGQKIGQKKWNIFKANAILLHPSYWDGVPYSVLEALGVGLCMIASRVGGMPDIIKDEENGVLLAENKPKNIHSALLWLYTNRKELERISKNNRKLFLSKYTVDRFLANMKIWFDDSLK